MVKRLLAWSLIVSLVALALPTPMLAAVKSQGNVGSISGLARDEAQKPLSNRCVQLRNLDTKQVIATARTNERGEFQFNAVPPGRYQVEALDQACKDVLDASSPVALTKAAMTKTDVIVIVSERKAPVGSPFFDSTGGALLVAAVGAGVTVGVGVARNNASPSK